MTRHRRQAAAEVQTVTAPGLAVALAAVAAEAAATTARTVFRRAQCITRGWKAAKTETPEKGKPHCLMETHGRSPRKLPAGQRISQHRRRMCNALIS